MDPAYQADVAVVGAGQAGLAAGHYLQRAGADFVIFEESDRVGASWRNRWDGLRLFTPAGFSSLPGSSFPADADHFPTRDEVVAYLESYADPSRSSIRFGARVGRAARTRGRWELDAGEEQWSVGSVIFAGGAHAAPAVPPFAAELSTTVDQLSSLDYRRPEQIRQGTVVVAGAVNSGAEIAADLAPTHRVVLAGRDVGHLPPMRSWMYPLMRRLGRPGAALSNTLLGGHGDPLGRLRPGDLEAAGITRMPRVVAVDRDALILDDGRRLTTSTVIWVTGLRPATQWLPPSVLDDHGCIRHHRGIAEPAQQLYTVGMPYQWSVTSHLLGGVGSDAKRIAVRAMTPPRRHA